MISTDLQRAFRDYLLKSDLQPGDKLETEIELAARFGVSRSAMREVIMHVCHMGILTRVKNRGTFLQAVSPEQIEADLGFCFQLAGFSYEELKETRLLLETSIVPLIARRISPATIDQLRANITGMLAAQDDPAVADALDRDFHLMLLAAANNRTLKLFSQVIYRLFRRQYRERYLTPAAVAKSAHDHEAILAALIAGNSAEAAERLHNHIQPT